MIAREELQELKEKNFDDYDINDLIDITQINIDRSKSVNERILDFINQVKNPYAFRVGNTPVKVSFSKDAPSFQKRLENLLTREF